MNRPDIIYSIRNAHILFPNFSGAKQKYNVNGNREFTLSVSEETADAMREEGWNVRTKVFNGDEQYQLKVSLTYERPRLIPQIYMVCGDTMTLLDADSVGTLDQADISNIDLVIRGRWYEMDTGAKGYKAWVKTMYVTVVEDEFAASYRRFKTNTRPASVDTDDEDLPF